MEKLNIKQVLKDGFIALKKNPIIFLPAFIFYLANIGQELIKSSKFHLLIISLVGIFFLVPFLSVIIRFIYEARTQSPSWIKVIKLVLSKYILILMTTLIYAIPVIVLAVVIGALEPFLHFLLVPIPLVYMIMAIFFMSLILLLIKFIFYLPAILIDNEGIKDSLITSWKITRGNLLRLIGLGSIFLSLNIIFLDILPIINTYFVTIKFIADFLLFTYGCSCFIFVYLNLIEDSSRLHQNDRVV